MNSTDPDLTPCFQQTVLIGIPCLFLLLITPYRVYTLRSQKKGPIEWWAYNVTKIVIAACIGVVSLADIFKSVHELAIGIPVSPVYFVSPLIVFLAIVLYCYLVQYERNKGVRTSGFLFNFWLLLLVAAILTLQSNIRRAIREGIGDVYRYVTFLIYFPMVLAQFILAAFIDREPKSTSKKSGRNPCPETSASFLSQITFWWFSGLVVLGYKKALERQDLWSLNEADRSEVVYPKFQRYWDREVIKCKAYNRHRDKKCLAGNELKTRFQDGEVYAEVSSEVTVTEATRGTRKPRLLPCLVKNYMGFFLTAAGFKFLHDMLLFVSPQLLRLLISFTKNKDEMAWRGYAYAVILLIVAMTQSLILHQYFHACLILGMRLRTVIIASIYRKTLKLSNAARKLSTVGEITNLMSVDAQRFMDLTTYFHMIWSGPFQIGVSLYFLWQTLGPSVLAGVAVMIFLIPINAVIGNMTKNLQAIQMNLKDKRIKLMNEVLNGIKVLKLYAWEPSFQAKILDIRNKELNVLKKMAYLQAITSFTWTTAPFMVSLTTFAVYVLSDDANVLDAEKAFVSLSLFNIIRFPLSMLPQVITNIVEASVSLKRLQRFLQHDELDPSAVHHKPSPKVSICMENGTFTWDPEIAPSLKGINLEVPTGSLVAVVGAVGVGKSSLLSALLGEMSKLSGVVNVKGSVAYVSQQAWIQNATLEENILFGKDKYSVAYKKIVTACALDADIEMLPDGDQTEIGEKGINLSGGQKQRVSVARAVCQDTDVYLLDDPLSAVDIHVGKHIFEHVIGPNGILKEKTRILVTHGISWLPRVDKIVVLKDGRVSEVGSFTELMDHAGAFADFLKNYLAEELLGDDNDDIILGDDDDLSLREDILSQLGTVMDDNEALQRQVSKISRIRTESQCTHSSHSLVMSNQGLRNEDSGHSSAALSKKIAETDKLEDMDKSVNVEKSADTDKSADADKDMDKVVDKDMVTDKDVETDNIVDTDKIADTGKNENAGSESVETKKLIQTESVETGRVKMSVFLVYIKAVGSLLSTIIVIFYFLYNISSIGANIWLSDWSNDALKYNVTDTAQRNKRLGVYGALGFSQGVAIILGGLSLRLGNVQAGGILHHGMISNIFASPMQFFDTTPLGRVLNRCAKDMDIVDTILPNCIHWMIRTSMDIVATIVIIGASTPMFLATCPPLGFIYYFIQRFYVATSRQLKRLESVSRSPIYSHFGETISGAVTIRAFGKQDRFIEDSHLKVDANQESYYPSIVSNRWLAIRLEFVGNFIIFFASLFAVLGRDTLSPGIVGLSISYAMNVTQTLNWMVRMTCELETNIVAVERIKEYTITPTEAPWEIEHSKPDSSWPALGIVQFRNYQTRYREGLEPVIKGISCVINTGEKIGIVGRTGAGKSSLTLGLFRIIEATGGSIYIDGVDISKIGLHTLRTKLTIIPQDPVLFSGSLRMNLDPFDQFTDVDLWRALEYAHLKTYVVNLPDQLHHECTEGGENLSVGQRQLVCLARALLRKTKILILDEATAAVDLETDDLIQATIRTEFAECTVLTIAHRLNTVMDYTKIMVLEAGCIKEFNTPQVLLQNQQSLFYGMAKNAGLI